MVECHTFLSTLLWCCRFLKRKQAYNVNDKMKMKWGTMREQVREKERKRERNRVIVCLRKRERDRERERERDILLKEYKYIAYTM